MKRYLFNMKRYLGTCQKSADLKEGGGGQAGPYISCDIYIFKYKYK